VKPAWAEPMAYIITQAGPRAREGQTQDQIADQLRPAIETVLDDLDRWTAASAN
jgi:hypothetical protein